MDFILQAGHSALTNLWARTPTTEAPIKKGGIPISDSRVTAVAESFACNVVNTI